jgi:hypothetical protein
MAQQHQQRLLWQPLWPRLMRLLRAAPDHPLASLVLIPVALPVAFLLPTILIWDAVLQWLYDHYSGILEVVWEDGGAMLDIAINSSALGGKELTRMVNQTVRRRADAVYTKHQHQEG